MALPSWLTLSAMSGSGNANVVLSTTEYWGRNDRSATGTVATKGGATRQFTVNVPGRDVFLLFDKTEVTLLPRPSSGDSSEVVEITGYSNAKNIKFTNPDFGVVFESDGYNIYINEDTGPSQSNGVNFDKDYGMSDRYRFKIKITVPNNPSTALRSTSIDFYVNSGETDETYAGKFTLAQQGAASTLSLNATEFELPTGGGSDELQITSNDSWTIS